MGMLNARRIFNVVIPPDIIDPPPQHPVVVVCAWAWIAAACLFAYYEVLHAPGTRAAVIGYDTDAYKQSRCVGLSGLEGSTRADNITFAIVPDGNEFESRWCLRVSPSPREYRMRGVLEGTDQLCEPISHVPPMHDASGFWVMAACRIPPSPNACLVRTPQALNAALIITGVRDGFPSQEPVRIDLRPTGNISCFIETSPPWTELLARAVGILVTAFGWLAVFIRVCFRREVDSACRAHQRLGELEARLLYGPDLVATRDKPIRAADMHFSQPVHTDENESSSPSPPTPWTDVTTHVQADGESDSRDKHLPAPMCFHEPSTERNLQDGAPQILCGPMPYPIAVAMLPVFPSSSSSSTTMTSQVNAEVSSHV
jgi:hypothetical protein